MIKLIQSFLVLDKFVKLIPFQCIVKMIKVNLIFKEELLIQNLDQIQFK